MLALAVAAGGALSVGSGTAAAASQTGWVGFVPPNSDGISFLDTSTIINSPNLRAESRIYTTTGNAVPRGYMGVRPRLFKSGVLCEAIDYKYNTQANVTEFTYGTSATCGSGSYNSHGFVSVFDVDAGFKEYVTFPSNPLNFTAPAARSSATHAPAEVKSGTNAKGQSFGSGDVNKTTDTPDLVQAYATNGAVGYIKGSDLNSVPVAASPSAALAANSHGDRTVPVYKSDGVTVVGQFVIR
ncbi:MAG: hypothetical protein INR66_00385 [Gordonia polyisoprenivorans]|nr:hypothetical protein [Gordonia polyisoprenivorans]